MLTYYRKIYLFGDNGVWFTFTNVGDQLQFDYLLPLLSLSPFDTKAWMLFFLIPD